MSIQDPGFQVARFRQIATPNARELSLREKPAVYAWYRDLGLAEAVGSEDRFIAKISDLVSARLSDRFSGRVGYLYNVTVQECGGSLSERKLELLRRIACNDDSRAYLASILESATFLQAPLYVGKAYDLRRRISEHVGGLSTLLSRFEAAGISLDSCVLRYRYINGDQLGAIADACGAGEVSNQDLLDEVTMLIEDLLTRFSPSAFVRRPG